MFKLLFCLNYLFKVPINLNILKDISYYVMGWMLHVCFFPYPTSIPLPQNNDDLRGVGDKAPYGEYGCSEVP